MKLNTDCVRDLLLYLESNLSYQTTHICINNIQLKDYCTEDLLYTSEKLIEAEYIDSRIVGDNTPPLIIVNDISFKGHQFLNNVRDDKVYSKTKSCLSFLKSTSIEVLSETASKVLTALISKQLNF